VKEPIQLEDSRVGTIVVECCAFIEFCKWLWFRHERKERREEALRVSQQDPIAIDPPL